MKIAPSILSANFLKLQEEIQKISQSGADYLHIDIMDGHFVPNLTFGPMIIKQIASISSTPLDIHLMVQNIPFFIELFSPLKPSFLSFHIEEEKHLHKTIQSIRSKDISPAIVLNPHSSPDTLKYILPDIDMVLLMSVNPGFGGQSFISHTLKKITHLQEMIAIYNPQCLIEVDGGINDQNAPALKALGVDILVAGNYIFNSSNYAAAISSLRG